MQTLAPGECLALPDNTPCRRASCHRLAGAGRPGDVLHPGAWPPTSSCYRRSLIGRRRAEVRQTKQFLLPSHLLSYLVPPTFSPPLEEASTTPQHAAPWVMPGDCTQLAWPVRWQPGSWPLHADLLPDMVLQADGGGMASSSRAELGPEPGRRGLGLARKDTPKQACKACRIRTAQQVTFLSF